MNGARRAVVAASLALAVGGAEAAEVAILKSTEVPAWRPALDALRRTTATHTLREFDLRNDRGEADRVLAGLKGRSLILVAVGPLAAQAAREAASDSALVFMMVQDPASLGLVGVGHVSGVAFSIPFKNQLAAFRLVNPRGVRVGVLYSPDNLGRSMPDVQRAANVVRLIVIDRAVASERDIPAALRALLRGNDAVDALWLAPDPVVLAEASRRFILSEALKAGKPVYSFSSALVQEGAMVSNGPDLVSIGEQAGDLVNRLAAGERNIETLIPRAELVVNKKVADKLRVEISAEALKAANRVF